MRFPFLQPLNRPVRDWQNQTIWIIGASSGIGAALARSLLSLDANVILSARRQANLESVANAHPRAHILAFDVADQNAWQSASQQLQDKFPQIDLVIFCAAKYQPERSWEVNANDAADTLKINLESVYHGLQTVLPGMLQRGNGGLAILASVAGYLGLPNASVYGPSKAALINLTELLYSDLHEKNINVYLVNPGFVSTELTSKNDFTMPALQTPEQASHAILAGIANGDFEIHFPKRFTMGLKLMQMLPYRLRFALIRRFVVA
ncbi:SDR family NAD(P)-dependent oxidoreductase [Undibacterium amnicola]|uniref:SDR family NAD(P)-dependent oxidoreductase n=1 Tax=Undibacterium amnicola TaxID=1834038 RepID=A0ABR6XLZ5_9BURK|nr:SDR family NAD(P)-dependent oxidoreductase [Undibacterium amnicola]MBC3830534.1 SDR family NAD(P)-dependent oxidoreductase [Undibacterium amnicola]